MHNKVFIRCTLPKDGTVSGWLTLETAANAKAKCTSGDY